jgi:hypothetical protein
MKGKPGLPFLVLGVSFFLIGVAGPRAFFAIGAAFVVIGIARLRRQKRASGTERG